MKNRIAEIALRLMTPIKDNPAWIPERADAICTCRGDLPLEIPSNYLQIGFVQSVISVPDTPRTRGNLTVQIAPYICQLY
jgi:hypothetical protein